MKLKLNLTQMNTTTNNLRRAGIEITHNFKAELADAGNEVAQKAREILERESDKRTNKRYWTGKLRDSIKSDVTEQTGEFGEKVMGVSIGPDMRTAPYAEWVEIGHYTGWGPQYGGEWWEGYHYMEQAFAEVAPKIPEKMRKSLKVTLSKFDRAGGKTKSRTTGQSVGFGL